MTYVEWPQTVNTRFFDRKNTPKPNSKKTEYISGRDTEILANTRFVFSIKCSVDLHLKNEYNDFWNWYTDELGGTAGVFKCPALKRTANSTEYFKFTNQPDESEGLVYKKILLELEEVY